MDGIQDLKRRIKSIKSTKQVTKAMEAVSASKMRKATALAVNARSYTHGLWDVVSRMHASGVTHPLLNERTVQKSLGILIASDRGLCGGLNTAVIKLFLSETGARQEKNITIEPLGIGKKANNAIRKSLSLNLQYAYEGFTDHPDFREIQSISRLAQQQFLNKEIDEVFVAYTDFQSSIRQVPKIHPLLPLRLNHATKNGDDNANGLQNLNAEFLFEPNPEQVFNTLLPRMLEMTLYQLLLESAASEHSARMLAMHNATDSAEEMIDELTLTYNQVRQASITQEIAEIVAGRLALSH